MLPLLAGSLRIPLISWSRRQVSEHHQILVAFMTYLHDVILLRRHEHILIFLEFTPRTTSVLATKTAERFPYSMYLCFRPINKNRGSMRVSLFKNIEKCEILPFLI
jgi:hypothetical protein